VEIWVGGGDGVEEIRGEFVEVVLLQEGSFVVVPGDRVKG